ncbi:hypothetical protein FNV43_RR12331 [Rhamnella rubrinervis]|uniref:CRC domain-containing protein n=1 Tax=Rhamnella rubrinervis TaxID=2594499 RepID=A0A8K0H756_9ROSA|nr:hypothetical protein FNV43_RR12331 [Rhamnella rubrinervis]
MDSPNPDKITPSAISSLSDSPSVQESPFSSFVSNLSPIKSVKVAHVAQGFPELASPPLVFTSPRINAQRETSLPKRSQNPQFSSAHDTNKDCDAKNSPQSESCSSSGCGVEFLTDFKEVDCLNTDSDNTSLKGTNNASKSLFSGSKESKITAFKFDDKSGLFTDAATVVEAHLDSLEKAKKDIQGKPKSDEPINVEEEQKDDASNKCPNIESGLHVSHAFKEHDCQNSHSQDRGCSHQGACTSTSQLLHESLQSVLTFEGCGGSEKVFHNQHGVHRRCLQFGEASMYSNSSLNATSETNGSSLAATNAEFESLEQCHTDLEATSSKGTMVNLPQPIATSLPPRYFGNSSTFCKPSGIGLHLNSIVNAASMGQSATASIKLEDHYMGVKVKQYTSVSIHLIENTKSCSASSNEVDKSSAGDEERWYEAKALIAANSASAESPNTVEFENQVAPYEKRKLNLQKTDSLEEYDQPSPRKKRKKTAGTDSDGCKRCNCKKTKCLKLYCDCFAAGIYCAEPCACQGCFNRPEYEDTVIETRQQIESRNPLAFAPKIVQRVTELPPKNEDGSQMTPSSARHKRGCNCKKSMCLKKYCECYQANVGCSNGCRCEGCKNVYGKKEEFVAVEHGVTKEMLSNRADEKRSENAFDGSLDLDAYDWPANNNIRTMDPISPSCDTDPSLCHLTAPSDTSSMALTSSRARNRTNVPQVQLCPRSDSLSSGGTLRLRNSPVTPITRLSGTKSLQGLDSGSGFYDILQDDTPEILKDDSTPIKSVKVSSPNKKRISPPHGYIHELGSSSSGGLRSGRKFILKAVPSFPPLTPCIDSKDNTIKKTSNLRDNNSNK